MTSNVKTNFVLLIGLLGLVAGCKNAPAEQQGEKDTASVWIGTYTRKEGHVDGRGLGIYRFERDTAAHILVTPVNEAKLVNPSFLTLSADRKFLYAVEETGPGVDSTGHVVAYAIENGHLRQLNRQSVRGFAPCYVSTDKKGRAVFVANYGGGIAMFPVGPDGSLALASDVQRPAGKGIHPRQDASHPHCAVLSPDEQYLYVADLGVNVIHIYKVDFVAGKLMPAAPAAVALAPAAGPRHLTFHPKLPRAYVINELNSTITTFAWNAASGRLDTLQTVSTLPSDSNTDNYCADIHLTPDGRFLYGTNRGHNSVVGFNVDAKTGLLSLIGHVSSRGDFPRNFAIDPEGKHLFVANQNSDNIVIYSIQDNGNLLYKEHFHALTPVCIQFE